MKPLSATCGFPINQRKSFIFYLFFQIIDSDAHNELDLVFWLELLAELNLAQGLDAANSCCDPQCGPALTFQSGTSNL